MRLKRAVIGIWLLACAIPAFAADRTYGIQAGFYNPRATDTGLILGGYGGAAIDERFDFDFSLDYYHRGVSETEQIQRELPDGTVIIEEISSFESSVTMLPLMANVRFKIPMGGAAKTPIHPYLRGGLGYMLSWHKYKNYETDESESKFYGGFGLRFALGASYPVGSASGVNLELFYMSAPLSRSEGNDAQLGAPVRSKLDMGGVGIRLGLQFGGAK